MHLKLFFSNFNLILGNFVRVELQGKEKKTKKQKTSQKTASKHRKKEKVKTSIPQPQEVGVQSLQQHQVHQRIEGAVAWKSSQPEISGA